MISYSWEDAAAAEVIHDEFALRGFDVIHDRYSFAEGSRIPTNMNTGVERCDVFVTYLTPNSLYLNGSSDDARPALVGELSPALRRRRQNLIGGQPDVPMIVTIAHGLGPREEAVESVRKHTGEDIGSLWSPVWLDQTTDRLTQSEAAAIAEHAAMSLLTLQRPSSPIQLNIATRGTTPRPVRFTLDATRILGNERRPGSPIDWARFHAALASITESLNRSETRSIRLELSCHLAAAYAAGRSFHQATGWQLTVPTRHGDVTPAASGDGLPIRGDFDQYRETGDLLIDIDLLGHNVASGADNIAARLLPLGGRISLSRDTSDDLMPLEIATLAHKAAAIVRSSHAALRPRTLHVMIAAPAAFAALFGYHLTALNAEALLYEFGPGGYTEALTIPSTAP